MLPRPIIRQATRADLEKFYGKGNVRQTMTARVGIVRGRIIGCGGLAYIDGKVIAFCDLKPSARRYKVSLVRAAREVIDTVRATGCRVMYAQLEPGEPGAMRWTASLGFEPTKEPGLVRWQV